MSQQEYEFHPYASVLPMLGTADANELAADIQANGLREDIVLFEGMILDGRNRYRACKTVNVEPRFRDFNGDGDPISYIVSVNLKRRHLTNAQREMVAAKMANMPRGDVSRITASSKTPINSQTAKRQNGKNSTKTTVSQAAKELGVSARNVARAKTVLDKGTAEQVAAIERGEKKVGTVEKEIKKEEAVKEKHFDETGYPVPDDILEEWNRAKEFASTLRKLTEVKSEVKAGLDGGDVMFAEVTNTTIATLVNAYNDLKRIIPYAVCTSCQGRTPKKCSTCGTRGFLSKFYYKTCIPEEVKKIRERAVAK